MSHLRLLLFGGFAASLDGQPLVAFGTDKARALLAYLAVESGRPHRRGELATLLWPDASAAKAAHNLSQTLLRLRRALREADPLPQTRQQPFLLTNSQEVQFNPLSDHWLDVAEFGELIRAQRQHQHPADANCPVCIGWLRQAVNLYRGDLLAGFALRDSVPFEEWQLVRQEALHIQAIEALAQLTAYYEQRGETDQVQAYARRLVALEPWHEPAQLKLMAALAASGQAAAALAQYAAYIGLLAAEFGATPSAAARALSDQTRAQLAGEQVAPDAGKPGSQPSLPRAASAFAPRAERRQVTALVCGRRRVTGRMDPEEALEALAHCSVHCDAVFARYGGQRQPRQGTECLVYFGYPVAQEDATQRAAHAGLAIVAAADGDHKHAIGIHTSMMVSLGDELVGEAPNLARSCHQHAEPGSLCVTADTERLIRGWFDCQPAGQVSASGALDGIPVYLVTGESSLGNRLVWLAQNQRLSPLVGRALEMQQLADCLKAVRQGRGQVVTLCGEAGFGKSRLAWELRRLAGPAWIWLESTCSPYFQNTSLYPLIRLLEQLLAFQPGDDVSVRRGKLEGTLERLDLARPATTWLLARLLGLPADTPVPQTITEDQRERMRAAVVTLLGRLAARQPLALVIEDLHWADPSTIAWLNASLDALAAAGCLVLLTYRPGFAPPWRPHSHLTELTLGSLGPKQAERIVADLAGDTVVSEAIRRRIVERADGVPLFVEELARAVFESDAAVAGGEIPATLHDSLAARLDQVGEAGITAGWAAALGREFAYPVLAAVVPYDEPRLQVDLQALTAAGLIRPAGEPMTGQLTFSHALIHEVAHGSLLKQTRQAHHRRIAEIYAARFSQIAEAHPELMAEHYRQAGLSVQAVDHWLRAGERATTQGAALEAAIFFDRALALTEPTDGERQWQALWGRETTLYHRGERTAQKADIDALLALAESLNDDVRRAQAQLRRARYTSSRADYREQAQAAEAAITAAQRAGRLSLEVEALAYKVTALLRLGERSTLPQAVADTLACAQKIGEDDIRSYAMAAVALYYLESGDLARAAQTLAQSLDAARRGQSRQLDLESQYHGHLGFAYAQLGLYSDARAALEAGLELANLMEIGRHQAYQLVNLGFVYWRTGDLPAAIQMEEKALQEYTATGEAFGQAVCRAYLGYMHEAADRWSAAAQYLADARAGFAALGVDPDRIETQATEARVLLALGQEEPARQLTAEVWQYLCQQGTDGLGSPAWVYQCVADVLEQVEIPSIALRAALEAGHRDIMQRADRISNAAWRRAFLNNIAENRSLVARWTRLQ